MKRVNRHELEGTFEQDLKFKARSKFECLIEDQMRSKGHVPVLDRNTEWFTSWNEEDETYDFTLFMYGVYVGKRKATEEICGWNEEDERFIEF